MKPTAIVYLIMLTLSGPVKPDTKTTGNITAPIVCSLGTLPGLQAYYLKKVKKEKLKYQQPTGTLMQAIENSFHFITISGLDKYFRY
jgi:hypothetical protein